MEVNNAVEEFKRYDQEYDEARVREQVRNCMPLKSVLNFLHSNACLDNA